MNFEIADKYKALKASKAEFEAMLDMLKKEMVDCERELVEAMTEEELQSFNRDGLLFYLNCKTYVSILPDRKAEAYEALKDNGFGAMVQETVNAQTFAAFVLEQMEDGADLPEWLEDKVRVYEETKIGTRKAAK